MSELTPCNYCTLKRIRRDVEAKNQAVKLLKPRGKMTNVSVFVNDKLVAWFWELTTRCVC